MTMRRWRPLVLALVAGGAALTLPPAHAGLFDDDEARKAILDLRAADEQQRQRLEALNAALTEQISVLRRSLLDLNAQIETLRGDLARQRGDNEQLAREIADLQRRQKDIAEGVDARIRKIEPQTVTIDGKEFQVDPEEKRGYEDALAVFRKGDFPAAIAAFTAFQRRYPSSGYTDASNFWLGNAYYGNRDYKEAINTFRAQLKSAPNGSRAPEAMLSIANCQLELKDAKAARATLGDLVKAYPQSDAAQAARDRLASLK